MVKKFKTFGPQLVFAEQTAGSVVVLTNEQKLSIYKKSQKSRISTDILEEVYRRGYLIWNESFGQTAEQFAFDRVNSFIAGGFAADLDKDLIENLTEATKPADRNEKGPFAIATKTRAGGLKRVPDTRFDTYESAHRYGMQYHTDKYGSQMFHVIQHPDAKKNLDEDLRNWFSKSHPEGGWKRYNSKGEAIGPCAREPGEAKPKCMSNEKAASLTKKERAAAVAAKRRHDPNPERKGKPINVSNYGKGKISEMTDINEENKPTNPALWSRAKALARQKFDVYPSAYANGWAAKWYKSKGGGWKSVSEEAQVDEACWTGYKQVGMKKKGDRMVPNCVPVQKEAFETSEKQSKNKNVASSRFDGTKSAKNVYQKATPGQPVTESEVKGDSVGALASRGRILDDLVAKAKEMQERTPKTSASQASDRRQYTAAGEVQTITDPRTGARISTTIPNQATRRQPSMTNALTTVKKVVKESRLFEKKDGNFSTNNDSPYGFARPGSDEDTAANFFSSSERMMAAQKEEPKAEPPKARAPKTEPAPPVPQKPQREPEQPLKPPFGGGQSTMTPAASKVSEPAEAPKAPKVSSDSSSAAAATPKAETGGQTKISAGEAKSRIMAQHGGKIAMFGAEKYVEPESLKKYARSVGIPVSGDTIGGDKPQSASNLSQRIKQTYNYDVSPETIKSYAKQLGVKVDEAYEMIEQMILEEIADEQYIESLNNSVYKILEDWQNKKYKNPSGGLTKAGVMAYRRENPGSKLQTAVTTKPSKLKKGSRAWNRRKSFCARMGGMKKRLTSAKTARDPDSRINKALRKWNC